MLAENEIRPAERGGAWFVSKGVARSYKPVVMVTV